MTEKIKDKNENFTQMGIRVDTELKTQCETLFSELGLSMNAAVVLFLKECVKTQGLPFTVVYSKKEG